MFFKEQNLPFEPKVSINERLQSLYKQIVDSNTGFNGLLFIIDEYESWLSQRDIKTPEGMFDSAVLQALTEILPKQYGYEIFTLVASQTDMPAQLHGRFKNLPCWLGQVRKGITMSSAPIGSGDTNLRWKRRQSFTTITSMRSSVLIRRTRRKLFWRPFRFIPFPTKRSADLQAAFRICRPFALA